MTRSLGAFVVTLLLLASLGCAGYDSYVRARGPLDGPISLTGGVYDPDGRLLTLRNGLREVGDFRARRRYWSLFRVIHGPSWDVTKLVNRRLSEVGGDAIIDLEVSVQAAPYQGIAMFLLILPTYFDVTLTGKIVAAAP